MIVGAGATAANAPWRLESPRKNPTGKEASCLLESWWHWGRIEAPANGVSCATGPTGKI